VDEGIPVQVLLVPSTAAPRLRGRQFLTSYLLNDCVAIDAGCLGFYLSPQAQTKVKHLFLTHSHLDHLASLPMFLDQAYTGTADCVTIYATAAVLDCLRRDMFNDRLWPDLIRISDPARPYVKLQEIKPGRPVKAGGLTFVPVPVDHVVPTVGYLVSDAKAGIVIASDTGPTEEIWQSAGRLKNLKAVFLEVTFPESMAWLADIAKHLTPSLFAAEARKMPAAAQLFAVHIHPRYRKEVVRELKKLCLANLHIGEFGKPYEF
jgi:ribonuclease BN (tRNA processing enzyme)